ncbi:MAG: acetyltransferase, partial [Chloroflexota bacterium]
GLAREVAWLVEEINREAPVWNLIGFIDENEDKWGSVLNGYPVLGGFAAVTREHYGNLNTVCAVGSPLNKKILVERAQVAGLIFVNLIHPNVKMSTQVKMGVGNIVCVGNTLTVNIAIGDHVILNPACTVGHDCLIGDYTTVAPGTNISGNVIIEEGCDLGTGCVIIQGIRIGEWTVVGAGAAVIRDIPAHCTAVGVPAKPIKFQGRPL